MLYSECPAAVQTIVKFMADRQTDTVRFTEINRSVSRQSYVCRDTNLSIRVAEISTRANIRACLEKPPTVCACDSVSSRRMCEKTKPIREDFPRQISFASRSRLLRAADHPQDIRFLTRTVRGAVAETRRKTQRDPDRERLATLNPVLFSACSHPGMSTFAVDRLRDERNRFLIGELTIFS